MNDSFPYQQNDSNISSYIFACARALAAKKYVTVKTPRGNRNLITRIHWDSGELVYRFRGELSKQKQCDPEHRTICSNIMTLHLSHTLGVVLCDNGPHSACPLLVKISDMSSMKDLL